MRDQVERELFDEEKLKWQGALDEAKSAMLTLLARELPAKSRAWARRFLEVDSVSDFMEEKHALLRGLVGFFEEVIMGNVCPYCARYADECNECEYGAEHGICRTGNGSSWGRLREALSALMREIYDYWHPPRKQQSGRGNCGETV